MAMYFKTRRELNKFLTVLRKNKLISKVKTPSKRSIDFDRKVDYEKAEKLRRKK